MTLIRSLEDIENDKMRLEFERHFALQKAYESKDVDAIMKAEAFLRKNNVNPQKDSSKAIVIDPFNRNINYGYYEKSSNLNFGMLRAMSLTTVPQAVLKTRKAQMVEFTNPQPDKYSPGFIIRKKRKSYAQGQDEKVSKQEQAEIDELTEFVLNCGSNENTWMSEDFGVFVQKFIDDSLSLDQGCFEIVRGRVPRLEEILEFYAVDGTTMRIADSIDNENTKNEKKEAINGYFPSYVQVIDGQIMNEWYPWELCMGIRNPQTNIRTNGYGRSELETLINTVTDLLNASSYNSNYFRIGSNPKGILKVKNMNTSRIEEFRQNWMADMAGVQNAHKMPIIDADTLDFVSTQQSNKDMEYHKYMEFLIKMYCAVFTISPEEIGFTLEGTGTGGGGLSGGDNTTELEYSRSKGLIPLVKFLQAKLNKFIVGPKSKGKYELVFLGVNQKTEEKELESDIKQVTNGGMAMQDFFRKYSGRDFKPDEDIILNPVYLQFKQMQSMMGGPGDPNSNEFVDNEEVDSDNPFVSKAQVFLDTEISKVEKIAV